MLTSTRDRLHLRNRDYDPTTATFLTPDPLTQGPASPELGTGIPFEGGTPVEANSYHYVANDPLNFVDPLGLCRAHDGDFIPSYSFEADDTDMGTMAACSGYDFGLKCPVGDGLKSDDNGTFVIGIDKTACFASGDEQDCEGLFGGWRWACDQELPTITGNSLRSITEIPYL